VYRGWEGGGFSGQRVGTHALHRIRTLDDVTDLLDGAGLPEAVDAVQCLSFYRRIPTRLNQMYASGHAKVETVTRSERGIPQAVCATIK
jgi:hypothetical protein